MISNKEANQLTVQMQLLCPSCNFWIFPHEKHLWHIYATSELRTSAVADSVLFFLCFHAGVVPDDGYDNLI